MQFFPFEKARSVQSEMVSLVEQAINERKHAVIHAPTGIGKTAATISPAVEYALKHDAYVMFVTSRQTQHKIVLETVRALKEKFKVNIPAASIIGKKWMCLVPGVTTMSSSDFSEFCRLQVENRVCEYFVNVRIKEKALADQTIKDLELQSPVSTEDIIASGKQNSMCPYELAVSLASISKVIIADYYYVFHPSIRNLFLKKANKKLENAIIIVDEGHNLPNRVRELMSKRLSGRILNRALSEAKKYSLEEAESLLKTVAEVLNGFRNSSAVESLVKRESFIAQIDRIRPYEFFVAELTKAANAVREKKEQSSIGWVAEFLESWSSSPDNEGFIRFFRKEKNDVVLIVRCLDPSNIVKDVINNSFSTILMSGTLTPVEMYRDVLGFPADKTLTKEFSSPFPVENKLTLVVPKTSTKFTLRSDAQFQEIARTCAEMVNSVDGCSAVFFPSYDLRNSVFAYFEKLCDKTLFLEHPGMSKQEKQSLLDRFKSYKSSGAVLLGVATGSFGEGIDLPGVLKLVVIVGLPLDKPNLETKELINYYQAKFGKGWDYGYILPAITKCFQNAGRCIRSENDRGVIVFLDQRYTWPQYFRCFPPDWKLKITLNYKKEIEEFFGNVAKI